MELPMAKEFEVKAPHDGWLDLHEIVPGGGEGEEVHVQCADTGDTHIVEAALRSANFRPEWRSPGRLVAVLGRD